MAAAWSGSACLYEQSAMADAPCLRVGADIRWKRVGVARVSAIVCHLGVKFSIGGGADEGNSLVAHQVIAVCHGWAEQPRELSSRLAYCQPHLRP